MEYDIQDFGLNWRSIEKPYIEIANPEKFLEILEAAGIEVYQEADAEHSKMSKEEIRDTFVDELHKSKEQSN